MTTEKTELVFDIYNHSANMQQKIMTLDKTMWGYNNFIENNDYFFLLLNAFP